MRQAGHITVLTRDIDSLKLSTVAKNYYQYFFLRLTFLPQTVKIFPFVCLTTNFLGRFTAKDV